MLTYREGPWAGLGGPWVGLAGGWAGLAGLLGPGGLVDRGGGLSGLPGRPDGTDITLPRFGYVSNWTTVASAAAPLRTTTPIYEEGFSN